MKIMKIIVFENQTRNDVAQNISRILVLSLRNKIFLKKRKMNKNCTTNKSEIALKDAGSFQSSPTYNHGDAVADGRGGIEA